MLDHRRGSHPGDSNIRIAVGDGVAGLEVIYDISELGDSSLMSAEEYKGSANISGAGMRTHTIALSLDHPPIIGSPVQRWAAEQRGQLKGKSLVRVPKKPSAELRFQQRSRPQSAPLHDQEDMVGRIVRQQPWSMMSFNDPPAATTKVQQFWKSSSIHKENLASAPIGGSSSSGRPVSARPRPSSTAPSRPPSAASGYSVDLPPSGSASRPTSAASSRPQSATTRAPAPAEHVVVDAAAAKGVQPPAAAAKQRPGSALPSKRPPPSTTRPSSAMARIPSREAKDSLHHVLPVMHHVHHEPGGKRFAAADGNGREDLGEDFDHVDDERQRHNGQKQQDRIFWGGDGKSEACKRAPRAVQGDEPVTRHRVINSIQGGGIMGTASPLSKAAHAGVAMPLRRSQGESKQQKLEIDSKLQVLYGGAVDWLQQWRSDYETEAKSFNSLELFCQVKMLEILNSEALNAVGDPNQFKTAVVCDMLERLCTISGSLEPLFSRIKLELMRSIYVEFKEDTSAFAMKPYFVLAATSAGDCKDAFRERDSLVHQLQESSEKIVQQKQIIRELREESQAAKLDAAWTRTKVHNLEVQMAHAKNAKGFMSDKEEDIFLDLTQQIKKLSFDLQAAEKMCEGAQLRVAELEHEVAMSQIQAKSAEKEWKQGSDEVDSLKREIAAMNLVKRREEKKSGRRASSTSLGSAGSAEDDAFALITHEGVMNLSEYGDDVDETLIGWISNLLGTDAKTEVTSLERDFCDSHLYIGLFNHVFPGDSVVRHHINSAETCVSKEDRAEVVAKLCHSALHCDFIDERAILGRDAWPHRLLLLELLTERCKKLEQQLAVDPGLGSVMRESIARIHVLRRRAVGMLLVSMKAHEHRVGEQSKALALLDFSEYTEATLMTHIQFSVDFDKVRPCFNRMSRTLEEGDRLLRECLDFLNEVRPNLRAVFRYYCKLSDPDGEEVEAEDADGEEVDEGKSSFLEGLDTMDLDEFRSVLGHARYSIPDLAQVTKEAFKATMGIGPDEEVVPGVGMGAVNFEECLVRMSALIAHTWSLEGSAQAQAEAPVKVKTKPWDVLKNVVNKHILVFCNKMHQLDFASEISKDGIPELWDLYSAHLRRVFSLYASQEAGTALSVGDFLCIMKDLGITGSRMTPPKLIDIFTMTQVIVAGSGQNETMSVDEFQEALSAVAVYMDPSPYLSLYFKIQAFISGIMPNLVSRRVRTTQNQF